MRGHFPIDAARDINRICCYLALDDFEHQAICTEQISNRIGANKFDIVIVFGNQVLETVTEACGLIKAGLAERLLLSGGRGHSTKFLFANLSKSKRYGYLVRKGVVTREDSEAAILAAIATLDFGIPPSKMLIESSSRNTGENATLSLEIIANQSPRPRHALVIQDPIMQRRAMLTLLAAVKNAKELPLLFSRSVFVPQVELEGSRLVVRSPANEEPWPKERFLALVLGEIKRLRNDERGYGPRGRGFIPMVEIPEEVMSSFENLRKHCDGR